MGAGGQVAGGNENKANSALTLSFKVFYEIHIQCTMQMILYGKCLHFKDSKKKKLGIQIVIKCPPVVVPFD
jgi:hypothetical protein